MRTNHLADALFPKTRQAILAATLPNSDRWWYMRELANHLGLTPSSLQRELGSLVRAGILVERREGKRVYFKAETESPVFSELRSILVKTTAVVDVIRRMMKPFVDRIDTAFLYGSIARAEEHTKSDVDLMIVGEIGLSELSPALRKAERTLTREINPKLYHREEFIRKAGNGDHFLSDVLKSPRLLVYGDPNELVLTSRKSARPTPQNDRNRGYKPTQTHRA